MNDLALVIVFGMMILGVLSIVALALSDGGKNEQKNDQKKR